MVPGNEVGVVVKGSRERERPMITSSMGIWMSWKSLSTGNSGNQSGTLSHLPVEWRGAASFIG